jgi:hypothetical protein
MISSFEWAPPCARNAGNLADIPPGNHDGNLMDSGFMLDGADRIGIAGTG